MARGFDPPSVRTPATLAGELRTEIAFLDEQLGETIELLAGSDCRSLVEELKQYASQRRSGCTSSEAELTRRIQDADHNQLRVVIRALTISLDLLNLAEDRQRIRVLASRDQSAYPAARNESVRAAVLHLRQLGMSTGDIQALLDTLRIDLVFTAHPTEAKRRSVRKKLQRLRELMRAFDSQQSTLAEEERTRRLIGAELAKLWQTDFIRPWRPSVLQEAQRGLSIKPVLWDVVPKIIDDLRGAVIETAADNPPSVHSCFRFGSWIGGDCDGHPGVTPKVTEQTVNWLRDAALALHLKACDNLFESLSLSRRQLEFGPELRSGIHAACAHWPQLAVELANIPPNETCRRWIHVIRWRLQKTQQVTLDEWNPIGVYQSAAELSRDVSTLLDAVNKSPAAKLLAPEVQEWLDRIDTFGLHLARLDVRQDARQYRSVIDELLRATGYHESPGDLDEAGRQAILLKSLNTRLWASRQGLTETAQSTLGLFQLLHRIHKAFGRHALGGHVISMTHSPSDVLAVLWFWQQTADNSLVTQAESLASLPIIPLFETIEDLQHGPAILDALFSVPEYRAYVATQHDRQTVMLGYSDSTKDGGYVSACWSLYTAQQRLFEVARRHGVTLTFFHGRGGSLGRGGGPTARSILSLPAGTFHGSLRLTEQGEVLADRYDDPNIAFRHLEQLVWSSLLSCGTQPTATRRSWDTLMDRISKISLRAYRQLVDEPGFVDFFRRTTPISEIERLPIGSRPARRMGGNRLKDLRAIPWVFSWTQCRCLIPAWYGLGSAVDAVLQDECGADQLRAMYQEWPFFRATIDNAELAIAKADLDIAEKYAALADTAESTVRVRDSVAIEFRRTRAALKTLTGKDEPLDGIPWLQESIRVRNRFIDPLNLIQVELLRRLNDHGEEDDEQLEEVRHLTRLTINGLAAGMRTSG